MTRKSLVRLRLRLRGDHPVPAALSEALVSTHHHLDVSSNQTSGVCEGLINALHAADKCTASSEHCMNIAVVTVNLYA